MLTTVKPPAEVTGWLLEKFETTLKGYRSGGIGWTELGLGGVQDMVLLKDDLEQHSYPRCYLCGWIGEGKEPPLPAELEQLSPFYFLLTETAPFRTLLYPAYPGNAYTRSGGTPGRYLRQGLPPV